MSVELALDAVVVASVAGAVSVGRRVGVSDPPPTGRDRSADRHPDRRAARPRASPGFWLAMVTGVIYVNQVLFTVYVLRVRHGDPSFVARYLPDGWFDLADHNRVITALARHFPAPGVLAPSVLRVQAFCELAFVVLAYLTACRWLDPSVYRRLVRPPVLWLGCASYTVTFGLVEWSLRNPYTAEDLVLRVAAAVVVPWWVSRTCAGEPTGEPALRGSAPAGARALLAFVGSAAALGHLVLTVYDTALLYNLGHLGARLPGIAVACAVLVASRIAAARLTAVDPVSIRPDIGLDTIASSLRWFLVLFFVCALPVRYGLGFGSVFLAATAGGLVSVTAVVCGTREAFGRLPEAMRGRRTVLAWLVRMVTATFAGLVGTRVALLWPGQYVETVLLRAAVLFLVCATVVCSRTAP